MTEQEYGEMYGWANLAVEMIWPTVHPDALVTKVECDPTQPNMVFTLHVFGPDGAIVDGPIEKIISHGAFVDEMCKNAAKMRAMTQQVAA
jgi:hypothetical protein